MPSNKLHKYFLSNGNHWKIKDDLRAMVSFQNLNLMGPLASLGKFDIIFCRNVAIYFNFNDRKELFRKITGVL